MFIRIKFDMSELKGYYSNESYEKVIENKTIPVEDRVNIFTKEEVEKLSSILDTNLKVEQVNTFTLSKHHLYKNTPTVWSSSSEEEKKKAKDYEEAYNNAEFLDFYLLDTSSHLQYVVDSDLLFSVLDSFDSKYSYKIIGTLKDLPSAKTTSELKVLDKLFSLEEKLDIFSKAQQFNTKVGVHISDLGLLNVKEVDVLGDACTDELQDWLDNGWRILAICPQPDQRRPDYVLGRNEITANRKRRSSSCR